MNARQCDRHMAVSIDELARRQRRSIDTPQPEGTTAATRRMILLLLAVSLPLAFAACGSAPAASPTTTTTRPVTRPAIFAVFVDANASSPEVATIREHLSEAPGIATCRYLDHSQSYQLARQLLGSVVTGLTPATTPTVFQCQLRDSTNEAAVQKEFAAIRGVYAVSYPGNSALRVG